MSTDVARPAEDSYEPINTGLLAIFARARQLQDEMIADNNALDQAWQAGDPMAAIAEMRRRTKEQVDKIKSSAKNEQETP